MLIKIFSVVLAVFIIISCTKNSGNIQLHGVFTETEPYAGRTQMNFVSNTTIIKTEHSTNGSSSDTFNYSFASGKIILKLMSYPNDPGTSLDFKEIDANDFTIENLYASIPEAPESFMTFKK